jgi:hypothetical protein
MNYRYLYLLMLVILPDRYSFSQTDDPIITNAPVMIMSLSHPVNFDGIPDEEAWQKAGPLKMIMHSPVFGKEPSELTDVRFICDDKYLYMGAMLRYSDPGMIRSSSYKRDYMGQGSDLFGFILDTYNDNENGLVFFTTPDGLRFDASVQRDAVITRPDQKPMNLSWNAFWDVLTKRDPEGWSTEIRVPLSSLRFQEINGEVRMGLIVKRWIPAKNEIDIFPAIPPEWGEFSTIKPSQAREIVLHGVKSAEPLYITPYLMAGYETHNDLNESGNDYWSWNKPAMEGGLDIKYGITSNLVLDLTVNTDFAQVEADDEKINLTRMALYFPEKRLFFLERANVFDFNSRGNNNLFYSRRIGLSDDEDNPEPIRIYGGGRLTGKINKWDIGFLDLQTAPLRKKTSTGSVKELVPSENFGVTRVRRQVMNENSYIGAIMTSRLGVDGTYNLAYGMDGIFRLLGNEYLSLIWSQTFEDSVVNNTAFDPARFMISWERRSKIGLGYELSYSQSGIHYNPGIGFETIEDIISTMVNVRYGWLPAESSPIYSHVPEMRVRYNRYVDDGSLMTFNPQLGWTLLSKSQWKAELFLNYYDEVLREKLEIIEDEVYIDTARYKFLSVRGELSSPQSRSFFTILHTEDGQYFGGKRISIRIEPTWNASRHFEIAGIYHFDHLDLPEDNIKMTNHILGVKALFMLNTKLSANAFTQYNTAVNEIITNFRIRYNPKEGNDLYFMINEGRNTELLREEPNLPEISDRAIMLKYSYTFNWQRK